ncbi:MAG: MlaD family protein [Bacteriovoracaceae bacterium]|nr:MlaD family protein [Bacteriovoracaceae bacterium]
MRVRKKDKSNLVKVGAFVAGLTLVLMVIIASIGKETAVFEPKVDIRARVENVSNLKTGSYVELKGIRIGSVTGVNIISEEEVEVVMTILEKELRWIKKDSRVSITTAGLVGDKFVEIYNGTKEAPTFNPEKDILIAESLTDLKQIVAKGDSIATVTERILIKFDNILVKLGDGNTIIETFNSLNKSAKHLEAVTTELKAAQMGTMVSSMNKSSASLERILSRVEKGPGTMNSLIYDESLHDELRALLGGAQRNKLIKYYIRESIKNSEQRESEKQSHLTR